MGQRWQFSEFGIDALTCTDAPEPSPGPGQIRLAIQAVSLNYRDLLMIRGHYDPRVPMPLVPCSDAVGVVDAVGEGVSLSVGTRRMPLFAQGWRSGPPLSEHLRTTLGGPNDGTLQSHIVVDADATVDVPDHLSDVEAATLPCAGVTAWHALEAAHITAGDRVLTLGTGGVSIFALQLARARGARVAITSSDDSKLQRAADLGAELTLNYRTDPNWGKAAAQWAGDGVDAVVEVGGRGTLGQSIRAIRVGGTIALIGVLADSESANVPLTRALMRSVCIQGIMVGSGDHFRGLNRAIAATKLAPVVHTVVPFERAPAAFRLLQSGSHLGKVVVRGPQAVS